VKVQYPGKEIVGGFCPSDGCTAIVDTGTYLLYGPEDQVQKMITSDISGCDHDQMPNIIFEFQTNGSPDPVMLTLRPIDYILKFDNGGNDECVLGVSPDKDVIWTLGQVFLRSFYTVFDRDSNQIGFSRIRRDDFQAIGRGQV